MLSLLMMSRENARDLEGIIKLLVFQEVIYVWKLIVMEDNLVKNLQIVKDLAF